MTARRSIPVRAVIGRAAAALAAASVVLSALPHALAAVLDGRIDPPDEYALHLWESRRTAELGGLDAVVSVTRVRDTFHLAVRLRTTLTAEDLEASGGFAAALSSAVPDAAGRPVRAEVLRVPADLPLGRRVGSDGGVQAVRRLDARLGVLVVEFVLPPGSVAVDKDGQPAVRLDLINRNPAHGNGNVGSQTFPAKPEEADALGLGRLPADPRHTALNHMLDALDAALLMARGDDKALNNLAMRSALTRGQLALRRYGACRAELRELLDRLDLLVDQKLVTEGQSDLREIAETLLRMLSSE